MNVLFLALGGSRRNAVVAESADIAARAGNRVVVLIGSRRPWRDTTFAEGVRVIDLAELERAHLPMRVETAILLRGPSRLVRAVGRGPMRSFARRAGGAYERKIGKPLHKRAVRAYRKLWKNRQHELAAAQLVRGAGLDYIVVADYASITCGSYLKKDPESVPVRFGINPL
jgi:hypothetical protein